MTFLFQIILISKQGNWHQAHGLVGMKDVEKEKELSTAKGKGKRKGFGGRRTRKTFYFLLGWLGRGQPFTAQCLDFGRQHKQGRGQHLSDPCGQF